MSSLWYVFLVFNIGIPALVGMLFYYRLPKPAKTLAILMLVGLFTELCLAYTGKKGLNNFYLVNIYSCIEVVILTVFFNEVIVTSRAKTIFKILCLLILGLIGSEMLLVGINKWSSYSSAAESVFIIGAGLYYFFEIVTGVNNDPIPRSSNFLFTGVILFYFISSLEYFLLNRYLLNVSRHTWNIYNSIHAFVNAFCNLAYALILWKSIRSHLLVQ